jgi:prevent-host-death family protein
VKAKLSELVEKVRANDEEIMITKNGRPAGVLVSPDEYESWKETATVRGDASLMREIKKGLSVLRRGRAKLYTLEELFR